MRVVGGRVEEVVVDRVEVVDDVVAVEMVMKVELVV